MNLRLIFPVLCAAALTACENSDPPRFQGYVEGETVHVASAAAGRLVTLDVARGATVAAGAPLFTLEQEREQAAVTESTEGIAVVRAQSAQARAQLKLAESNLRRARELRAKGLTSEQQVDQARSEHDRALARQRELDAQRQTVEAQNDQVRWQLTQKTVSAPAAGLVEDTIYRVGEWVPAGAPVVSLLPPENRLVRFFVPESALGALKTGQPLQVFCDGCAASIAARITYLSPTAEFTPPVIYSREARQKLVFRVEAKPAPADAAALHPGQPVEVELVP